MQFISFSGKFPGFKIIPTTEAEIRSVIHSPRSKAHQVMMK